MEESKKRDEAEIMRERMKEKTVTKNKENTEVVNNAKLPTQKKNQEKRTENKLDPFIFKGKESNVFGVSIKYPPAEKEKEEIKKINTEDIFPKNLMIPNLKEQEQCEHGNDFLQKLNPKNIESRNPVIHNTNKTKDSRNNTLLLMFLSTDCCNCKKYFTGESKQLLRVSPVQMSSSSLNRTVHFVSYHLLFNSHE